MAKINFLVPPLSKHSFTGGIWCIFEYARGLTARGHDVSVVPILPSPQPCWFPGKNFPVLTRSGRNRGATLGRALLEFGKVGMRQRVVPVEELRRLAESLLMMYPKVFTEFVRSGLAESYIRTVVPAADINIATSFETARPAALLGGKKFYFAQHYEPYFATEKQDSEGAKTLALQSYHLGFRLVANSSWLLNQLRSELGDYDVDLCPNAIDHKVFWGEPKQRIRPDKVVLISYGGRNAEWKGFLDMAKAVARARSMAPDINIEWRVYGKALLPPGNNIASYHALGFLSPPELSSAYREADILLSASWYESFPLFPLEAMACGLAVVTTQSGTEEYAIPAQTAEVVEARSTGSISDAILKLVNNPEHCYRIAVAGNRISREFTWERSVRRLEDILLA
ncbi:glycosyl transferase, group 1 family [Acidobacterium capsulatum ATCC 51196]|uniref:Glycosyl transferase, group 1 family n=2 Tax=Acidobacteriaceae TaxID=204434 RepID=C1F800_ACIC5|nr:glycosyl transferase, group 1 family [Acidobacterium capsulatum ATCC 51196]